MSEKVLITILGKQKIDTVKDSIEMTTVGTLEESDSGYLLRYKEEQEPPLMPNNATLKISKDERLVEMIRTGTTNSCLIIEKSKRNLCHYSTEYGDMLMGIYGRHTEIEKKENELVFSFAYDIDINGALTSQNEVTVTVKNTNRE